MHADEVTNLLDPGILFFALGLLAVALRSDLDVPQPIPKFLSLYLLISIGFRGGHELAHGGFGTHVLVTLGLALAMAVLIPLVSYAALRSLGQTVPNAAAIAAAYGSVSAVTFATTQAHLERLGVPSGGHLVAAMALMESPAILVAIFLAQRSMAKCSTTKAEAWPRIFSRTLSHGSVFVLLGALVVGLLTGERSWPSMKPFLGDIYKGMLTLFLLDLGLVAGKRLPDLKHAGIHLVGFAVVAPVVFALTGMMLARWAGLGEGDALLFTLLCGSASYIAVPAAMRLALPEATPGLYVSMPLALTFPLNVTLGIPLYHSLIQRIWS
jgi:hypothetical protein